MLEKTTKTAALEDSGIFEPSKGNKQIDWSAKALSLLDACEEYDKCEKQLEAKSKELESAKKNLENFSVPLTEALGIVMLNDRFEELKTERKNLLEELFNLMPKKIQVAYKIPLESEKRKYLKHMHVDPAKRSIHVCFAGNGRGEYVFEKGEFQWSTSRI